MSTPMPAPSYAPTPTPATAPPPIPATGTGPVAPAPIGSPLIDAIKACLEQISRSTRTSVISAIEAGKLLARAKAETDANGKPVIKHGMWTAWLNDNFKLSERTARRYMHLAEHEASVMATMTSANSADKMATVAASTIREAEASLLAKPPKAPKAVAPKPDLTKTPKPIIADAAKGAAAEAPAPDDIRTTADTLVNTLRTISRTDALRAKAEAAKIVERFRGLGLI